MTLTVPDQGYAHIRPRSYDAMTGMPFKPWQNMTNDEVVADVLNDLRANDRERDLALRLLDMLEGSPQRAWNGPRRYEG